mmetsp:Transcript_5321/g.13099  ORF Transcript_5321/g.13099 Transcript_5321/m.13099 type:complete len:202 (-) Transcript_5321:482-1087(-)
MKQASVRLATARAVSVFPVPGGPYNKIPLGGSIPNVTKRSGCKRGVSRTSRSFSIASLAPPTSSYVTSGLSSTVMRLTVGSILGGSGIWIEYLERSTPTRMPSSISVGATFSPSPTTNLAICLTLMTYLLGACALLLLLLLLLEESPGVKTGASFCVSSFMAASSRACLSSSLTPQWGVMSPTVASARSWTSAMRMHRLES